MSSEKTELSNVSLSEWITALREEITLASAQRAYQMHELVTDYPHAQIPNFRIKNISIEMEVVTSRSIEGGANVKFWILNSEAKTKNSSQITQRLKFDVEIINELTLGEDDQSSLNSNAVSLNLIDKKK